MFIAAYIVVALTVALCVASIRARQNRKSWKKEKVVHLPFSLAVVGMVCGGILCIPRVLCAHNGDGTSIFFCVAVLVSDSMMVAYLNCVIRYDDQGFLAGNFLGIKRECGYGEVEGIRLGNDCRIYFRGHSILIDAMSYGGSEFIQAVENGHKRATGKQVPNSKSFKRKWDPMNGHLDYPWLYFILWVAMSLLCVALPTLAIYIMSVETDPADIVIHNVQFSAYEVKGSMLKLYIDGENEPFEIEYYQYYGEALPDPDVLCNGETYRVGVEGEGHRVRSLTGANGTQYITLESERQVYRDSQRIAVWIVCILSPVGLYCCYLGIAVARHPERYSKRTQRLFYKDGFLH